MPLMPMDGIAAEAGRVQLTLLLVALLAAPDSVNRVFVWNIAMLSRANKLAGLLSLACLGLSLFTFYKRGYSFEFGWGFRFVGTMRVLL